MAPTYVAAASEGFGTRIALMFEGAGEEVYTRLIPSPASQ